MGERYASKSGVALNFNPQYRAGMSGPGIHEYPNPLILKAEDDQLDDELWQNRLGSLQTYRRQARIQQADNRMEMAIDEDFYDGIQLDPDDISVLTERKQPILTYNVIMNTINWILGTEKRARIDYDIRPRNRGDEKEAKLKTKIFKYDQDISHAEYQISKAFEKCIKAGVGWLDVGARNHADTPIYIRYEDWRNVWFDHLAVDLTRSTARYLVREKWIDLDIVQELFPNKKEDLQTIAEHVNAIFPYNPDDIVITDPASEFDVEGELDSMFSSRGLALRDRVKMVECWYRVPARVPLLRMVDKDTPYGSLDGTIYRKGQEDHDYLVKGGYFQTYDVLKMIVRCAYWAGNVYLKDVLSPYNHWEFPLVPMWCYIRARDNMPYGVIRNLRDPQIDLNKRRSKALFLLSTNQIIAEKNAVDDKQETQMEANRPDGYIELNGAGKRFEIVRNLELGDAHMKMAQDDERFINSHGGNVDPELAKSRKEVSGKAVNLLEQGSQLAGGQYWDNYYLTFQMTGEIRLVLMEQFRDQQEDLLVTGDAGKEDFVTINELRSDGSIENPITKAKACFIVGKQDYRESIRLAQYQMLNELILNLSRTQPQVALAVLDLVIDLMDDLPNKDEWLQRIRKINKQHAPEDTLTDQEKQEVQQHEAQEKQKQQMIEQLQIAMLQAKVKSEMAKGDSTEKKSLKELIDAQVKQLEGYLKALETAVEIQINPAITAAADSILEDARRVGQIGPENGDKRQITRGQQGPQSGGM